MFISLWIWCVTERERRGRQWRGGLSLPRSLSLLWQESASGNWKGAFLWQRFRRGGRRSQVGWRPVELISKAKYGTFTQTTESHFTPTAPLPSLLHHLKGDLLHLLPITDAHLNTTNVYVSVSPQLRLETALNTPKFSWGGGGAYKHNVSL